MATRPPTCGHSGHRAAAERSLRARPPPPAANSLLPEGANFPLPGADSHPHSSAARPQGSTRSRCAAAATCAG
eukprot:420158-Prorocentrum_minimum.AAC.2